MTIRKVFGQAASSSHKAFDLVLRGSNSASSFSSCTCVWSTSAFQRSNGNEERMWTSSGMSQALATSFHKSLGKPYCTKQLPKKNSRWWLYRTPLSHIAHVDQIFSRSGLKASDFGLDLFFILTGRDMNFKKIQQNVQKCSYSLKEPSQRSTMSSFDNVPTHTPSSPSSCSRSFTTSRWRCFHPFKSSIKWQCLSMKLFSFSIRCFFLRSSAFKTSAGWT